MAEITRGACGVQRADLHKTIWSIADDLRGSVDGWDFKQYVLGMLFYRFISEYLCAYLNATEAKGKNDVFDYSKLSDTEAEFGRQETVCEKGFYILPSELFCNVLARAKNDENLNETLERVFKHIEGSAVGTASEGDLKGLFDDVDVNSAKLGTSVAQRNSKLLALLTKIGSLDFGESFTESRIDAFGDAYEYLMGMYASHAGKSGGEFFTPQEVSELLARIALNGKTEISTVYDPCCGSGSLLLRFVKVLKSKEAPDAVTPNAAAPDASVLDALTPDAMAPDASAPDASSPDDAAASNATANSEAASNAHKELYSQTIKFYGQEINLTTYNLCRINMFLHGITFDKFDIALGDTLKNPAHSDCAPFDVIVSNPPYSMKWEGKNNPLNINDPRFSPAGVLAPPGNADLAFTMHMLSWLATDGTAAIVEFPGVLYRGGAERKIRKYLIANNFVDIVIQLPPDLFFGTSIATCILVLKKSKISNDVLFIDASTQFIRRDSKNKLAPENIAHIMSVITKRSEKEYFSKLVANSTILENDVNLSVSSYVEKEDTREVVDIKKLNEEIRQIVARQQVLREEIDKIIAEIEE